MRDAWWFANFCPYFSVFDLDRFCEFFGETVVTRDKLIWLKLNKAVRFFDEFSEKWLARQKVSQSLPLKDGQRLIYWGDEHFPEKLKTLTCPPSLLFIRGNIKAERPVVAVVGARNPTHIGRLWVQRIVPKLCAQGIVIASGGARGIDAEAHHAALACGGETWAFLPGAVEKPYPQSNEILFEQILKKGALISEFSCDVPVRRENFQRRNRLIAGVADAVVIVEAGMRSGTFMTAGLAIAENRDILVVPGPPLIESYTGSLELLSQGAGLARDENDIILCLRRKNALKLTRVAPTLGSL